MKRLALAALLLLSGCAARGQLTVSNLTVGGTGVIGNYLTDPTPPMGWSSWPTECTAYPCTPTPITEAAVKASADRLADPALSGLCAVEYAPNGGPCVSLLGLGYNVTGIFETWDSRDGSGNLQCIPAQFADGCSGIGAYIHGKGEQFGLYGAPGTTTCAGYPAQHGHETADAVLLAGWGVDYWYYDWCTDASSIWGNDSAGVRAAYQTMGTALQATGRRISYLVNNSDPASNMYPPSWFAQVGGTSVRVGEDNMGVWWYAKAQGDLSFATPYQNKGHWLDFDILMGNLTEGGAHGTATAVSDAEARAQFNFYAIAAAPLFIGSPINLLDSANLTTYANSEAIAVDQDALGKMGSKVSQTTCGTTVCQVWARTLANGDYAVALLNFDPSATHAVAVSWSDFSQSGTFNIRDLWSHASAGSSSTGYSVSLPAWGSALIRLSR